MVSPPRQLCRHLPPSRAAHPREAAAEQCRAPPPALETALGGGRATGAGRSPPTRLARAAWGRARARARGGVGREGAAGGARARARELAGRARRSAQRGAAQLGASPAPLGALALASSFAFAGSPAERCSEATARGAEVPATCPRPRGPEPASPRGSRLAASPRPLPSLVRVSSGE